MNDMSIEERRSRDAMIVVASRRGITSKAIGERLGISYQRVSRILIEHGSPAAARRFRRVSRATKTAFVCTTCGKTFWPERHRADRKFCSNQCQRRPDQRKVTDDDVVAALELRRAGAPSWAAIAAQFGVRAQSIQLRVWRHLAESGQLTAAVVEPLWHTRQPPKWGWLEQQTGQRLQP